jgi:hypothetical protein
MVEVKGRTSIVGKSKIRPEIMALFVKEINPSAQDVDEIAKCFIEVGKKYGIRGDIAFCQSIIETGWFSYKDSAVTPDQHNYGGLGVTSKGEKGNFFESVCDGVTAQIQHLFAYATHAPLPANEDLLDQRYKYVARGIAPTWEELNMRWAMNEQYGQQILAKYEELLGYAISNRQYYEPDSDLNSGSNIDGDLPHENSDDGLYDSFREFWNKLLESLKIKK